MEIFVEFVDFVVPFLLALGNLIEVVLDFCREVVVHYLGEIFQEKIIDHHAHVGRNEFAFLGSGHFRAFGA